MKNTIRRILDKNGIMNDQEHIVEELARELTEVGYVHIDSIMLDPERIILCVSKIMNELQEEKPIMISGVK